jgi:DNA-binding Xre family transcriptional regulator
MKHEINVSKNVVRYIMDNHISIIQMSKDIGISVEKLKGKQGVFNAEELLKICFYLNVRPEDMK